MNIFNLDGSVEPLIRLPRTYLARSKTAFRRIAFLLWFAAPAALTATTVTLDFEGFPDGTVLTTQYPGLTFSNAIVLSAGISLNEFEFPPHSGVNVASDNGGPIVITFDSPVLSVSGYFTFLEPLTLTAYDASDKQVADTTSIFSNNWPAWPAHRAREIRAAAQMSY